MIVSRGIVRSRVWGPCPACGHDLDDRQTHTAVTGVFGGEWRDTARGDDGTGAAAVRGTAKTWETALTAFITLITAGVIIKGKDSTDDLGIAWRFPIVVVLVGGGAAARSHRTMAHSRRRGRHPSLDQDTAGHSRGPRDPQPLSGLPGRPGGVDVRATARYVDLVIPYFAVCRARAGNAPVRAPQFTAGNAGDGGVRLPVIGMVPAPWARSPHPGADDPVAGDHLAE